MAYNGGNAWLVTAAALRYEKFVFEAAEAAYASGKRNTVTPERKHWLSPTTDSWSMCCVREQSVYVRRCSQCHRQAAAVHLNLSFRFAKCVPNVSRRPE